MTTVIVILLIIGYLLIATENFHKINKAAVAMFVGVLGWLCYMLDGTTFVLAEHAVSYFSDLGDKASTPETIRAFIGNTIFLKYITKACEVVLFFLATMSIVEVLNNNGCFDFVPDWFRTKNSNLLLWTLSFFTFALSANLDNFTTTSMMLVVMHTLVTDQKQRFLYGSAIMIAATCGGAFTVIGDMSTLTLWVSGVVSPTSYSASLFIPALVAMIIPIWLIGRKLPEHLDSIPSHIHYFGDDTPLNKWQRLIMLVVGIGGLWSIPTFHRITCLPPFVGALCVLSLLWVVNEIYNRKLLQSDQMVMRRLPRALQYGNIQSILFFIGIVLAVGAISETGVLRGVAEWSSETIPNVYILGAVWGALASLLDSTVLVLSNLSIFSPDNLAGISANHALNMASFSTDSVFWHLLGYATIASSILTISSMAGYALMKIEKVTLRWYVRHISGKVLLGWIVGLIVFYLINLY